jgi:phosphatidate cytidylyltransferase
MFVTRLISGVILLAIMIGAVCLGGPVLYAFLLVISLIGMFELYRAVGVRKRSENLLTIIAYAGAIGFYVLVWFGRRDYYLPGILAAMIALLFIYVFLYPNYHADQVMAAFFGIVYVAVSLSFIYQTRALKDGAFSVWLIFICSWGCDTMAYVTGRLFGKHKLAPVLSPKKTVEGAIGGVAGAAVIGGIYAACVGRFMTTGVNTILVFPLISAVGALVSMVGDLAASAIKRNHNIKDYGKLIPGHGGILDRYDSVIITAPIIYLLAYITVV